MILANLEAQEYGRWVTLKDLRETGVAGEIVQATGVVTAVEFGVFFLQDETAAMPVEVWNSQQLVGPGDRVGVRGSVTGSGLRMRLQAVEVAPIGPRPLPEAEPARAASLLSGAARFQRVRLTGVVHDISMIRSEVELMLRSDRSLISVCWHPELEPNGPAERPDFLLDAVVEVTGVAQLVANTDGGPARVRIPLASSRDVRVIQPGALDVWQRPERALANLRTEPSPYPERFRTHGIVTTVLPDGDFYFQDTAGAARVNRPDFLEAVPELRRPRQENPSLRAGDFIELVASVEQDQPGKSLPRLLDAEWRVLRRESPPRPQPLPAASISPGDHEGCPVSVTGEVIAFAVEHAPAGHDFHLISLNKDGVPFSAMVPVVAADPLILKKGEYVRLEGVVIATADRGFRIYLPSFAGFQAEPRPWPQYFGQLLGGILLLGAGAATWIAVLRRQVRQQTAQLLQSNAELHDLERQLRSALGHERELNALKSGFVNTISHEFRTPLGIILFASSMLRRFNETFSPQDRTVQLDAIEDAVERMNELVEQSLSLGRAEVAAPRKTHFDFHAFCIRVVDEITSATAHRSPIALEWETGTDPTAPEPVYSDETMLRTIVANLLGNAVKYSPAGSPSTLRISLAPDGRFVITIRDHGPGLDPEDLPKLFTTFHRGKGTEGIPGSGLGLAIVKRCAEALGGVVSARNAPGGGAEFTVTLPLFAPPLP